ncbi:MAG: SNF2-related protein [Gammaproteobacteria bacterium]
MVLPLAGVQSPSPALFMRTPPYAHQSATFEESKDRPYYAFLHAPGLGKTWLALATAVHLFQQGKIQTLLYIAPNGVIGEIIDSQVPLHMVPGTCTAHRCSIPTLVKAQKQVEAALNLQEKLTIIGINIEAMSHAKGVEFCERVLRHAPALMVVDESTTIGSPKSLRTKAVIALGKLAPYRRIMTGTIIGDSILEIPSQLAFLGPLSDLINVRDWWAFRARYCELMPLTFGQRTFIRVVGARRMNELLEKLKPFSSILTKEEVFEMPLKIYQRYNVELDPPSRKAYKQMAATLEVELAAGTYEVDSVLGKVSKLRQIVAGFIIDGSRRIPISHARHKALLELLSTLPGKIVLWAAFVYSIDHIYEDLRRTYGTEAVVRYDGQVSFTEREVNYARFVNCPVCRFFVASQQVAGYGKNLQAASIQVFFSNGFSGKDRMQAEDRSHRIGQEHSVLYIDIVATNTIDEKILAALKSKKDLLAQIMNKEVVL